MMFNVRSDDTESRTVRLLLGTSMDGIIKGDSDAPAVRMMPADNPKGAFSYNVTGLTPINVGVFCHVLSTSWSN